MCRGTAPDFEDENEGSHFTYKNKGGVGEEFPGGAVTH